MSAHERAVEARELVGRLEQTIQFGALVRAIATEECYFKHGGLNCAAAARQLGTTPDRVREMLAEVRANQQF